MERETLQKLVEPTRIDLINKSTSVMDAWAGVFQSLGMPDADALDSCSRSFASLDSVLQSCTSRLSETSKLFKGLEESNNSIVDSFTKLLALVEAAKIESMVTTAPRSSAQPPPLPFRQP